METETLINVVGSAVLIALLALYFFVLVPLHRRSERFRRWVTYGLFLWFGSIVAIFVLMMIWETLHGKHARPPTNAILTMLSIGPIILIAWRTGVAASVWRWLPQPLTDGLETAGRTTANATNAIFAVFAALSSAAFMALLWIAGFAVVAGLAYLIFVGAAKLPVSIAVLIGALIIAAAIASRK
jgi:hypothetical protein